MRVSMAPLAGLLVSPLGTQENTRARAVCKAIDRHHGNHQGKERAGWGGIMSRSVEGAFRAWELASSAEARRSIDAQCTGVADPGTMAMCHLPLTDVVVATNLKRGGGARLCHRYFFAR